jgi:hypothetical protein
MLRMLCHNRLWRSLVDEQRHRGLCDSLLNSKRVGKEYLKI